MKNVQRLYAAVLLILLALWLFADPLLAQPYSFFGLRGSLVQGTGIVALGVMSVGMMLALRPVRIEPFLGGLDKMYRLHKWLGITALVVAVLHWLWAKAPKWLVGWGLLERPARQPRPEPASELLRWMQAQRHLAESLGEWAFYAAVILIGLALVKRFPYRYFYQTHRLMAVVYLVLVFHGLILLDAGFWRSPLGPVMALLMAGGTVAACVSLLRRVGLRRQAVGEVAQLVRHTDNQVLQVVIQLKDRWAGHEAGQFAFVTFDDAEGAHPFTISSSWRGDGRLVFLIKGLGDYTSKLPDTVQVGDVVKVEGPYGRFKFECSHPRQIWVAGGIGVTPFIARLLALADAPALRTKTIDLFYSTSAPDENFLAKLRQAAAAAQVRLHILISPRDGRLDAERICQTVPDWHNASIWFCGPAGFGAALRSGFMARGLAPEDFHQELFELR